MATYHVRSDGTAASKEAATGSGGASTFLNLSNFNSEVSESSSGDIWEFHDGGGTMTGTLDIDGIDNITLQAANGDSPHIQYAGSVMSMLLCDGVTIDGLELSKSSGYAYGIIHCYNPGDNCTIKNCTIHGADDGGLVIGDYTAMSRNATGWVVEDNVFYGNGVTGTNCVTGTHGYTLTSCIFRRNTSYLNCTSNGNFGGGMKFYGHEYSIRGFEIYDNYVYNNGPTTKNGNQSDGVGIYMDATSGSSGSPNLIHDNYVWDNNGNGIFIEISDYCYAYNNVCIGNGLNTNGGNAFIPANIAVDARGEGATPYYSRYNKVIGNSCYGGRCGMKCSTYDNVGSTVHLLDNIFKNNICSGWTECALSVVNGGTNDANGSGNVYDNNCLGEEDTDFIEWEDNSYYSTYSAWATAHGESWTQIEGDPLYTNPGSRDLTLQSSSPCLGEGDNTLGAPFNTGLMPSSTWPDGVVTGDRDSY